MRIATICAIAGSLFAGSAFASVKLNNLTPQLRMNTQQSTKVRQTVDTSFGAKLKAGPSATAKTVAASPTKGKVRPRPHKALVKAQRGTVKRPRRIRPRTPSFTPKARRLLRKGNAAARTRAAVSNVSRKYQRISNALKASHQAAMNSVRNMK